MSIDSMSETKAICELELMSVNRAAKLLRVNKNEIETAMDLFKQSGGRDGLAYIAKGSRRVIRAGAIKAWLIAQERKEVAA